MRRFDFRNKRQERLRIERRPLQMHVFEHIARNAELLVGIDDGKRQFPTELRDVFAKYPNAERVKRRQMALACAVFTDEARNALAELASRFIGKTHGDDFLWRDLAYVDEISYAMRNNARFAAPSTG